MPPHRAGDAFVVVDVRSGQGEERPAVPSTYRTVVAARTAEFDPDVPCRLVPLEPGMQCRGKGRRRERLAMTQTGSARR